MELTGWMERLKSSRRILVLGPSGAGKTRFSISLARLLEIPLVHLDACFWKPGWVSMPQQEWRARVRELVQGEAWIMDGTYEASLDLRIPAADTAILLECPRWTCLWRVLKRRLNPGDAQRPDAPPGQRVDRAFLRYIWRYPSVTRPFVLDAIRRYGADKTLIVLRDARQIASLQEALERERRAGAPTAPARKTEPPSPGKHSGLARPNGFL